MRCPHPDTNAYKCHIQERHTVDDDDYGSFIPPPFLASTPVIFGKLDGDSICLRSVIMTKPDVIKVLTSMTKEKLSVFSCLEILKRQQKENSKGVLFCKVVSLEPEKV